jgi:predicted transcriptional regulator
VVDETLLELASDIVIAHVRNNQVEAEQLPQLIRSVYGSLSGLGVVPEVSEPAREPAVSIRASVKPDAITCLECGVKLKLLKRHLKTHHGLSVEDYGSRWNLKADYPLVAPKYAERRKALALELGLGRKPGTKVPRKQTPEAEAQPETSAIPKGANAPRKRRAKKDANWSVRGRAK